MRALTRQERAAAVVAAVIILAVLVWRGSLLRPGYRVLGAVEGVERAWDYPPGHHHLAEPGDIGSVLWGPHPLYTDPCGPGKYRDPLIARGWEFLSDPPSEQVI